MFCGILENYSSFCTRKKVVIKPLKFLNRIDSSCLGFCILEVAGVVEATEGIKRKKKVLRFFFFFFEVLQRVKQGKNINKYFWFYWKM